MPKRLRLTLIALASCLLVACGGDEAPQGGESIRSFTEGMQWQPGFVPLYVDHSAGKVYLLLDDSNRELLYMHGLPRGVGSNDLGLDRGQLPFGGAYLVRFEAIGPRVLLKRVNTTHRADSDSAAERRSVEEAFASSVLWGFPVVARDGGQRLVDATGFLLRDSHGVGRSLRALGQGNFATDASRSAIHAPRIRAFPRNTELEAMVTLVGEDPGVYVRQAVIDPHAITVHMHHSFIALPEPGYTPRRFHPESGYWAHRYVDYAAPITETLEQRLVPRHRLSKKNPGRKLSRAVEPIVYYLDPGTPEPVRSALLEGASWWAQAFEAAGFMDAFRVEMLPEEADPMDVRYNVIQWVHRATRGWSYGNSVVDPRTGEIIKGHVTLGSLRVRQDLLIARGMTAPFEEEAADGDALTSEMALARIRQLSAHEVGHTLGLAHNFTASVRDRDSVMDYPHPQLSLSEEGEILLDDAYAAGIGDWDKRAITYGYGEFGGPEKEPAALQALLAENRALGYEFISDPDSRSASDFHPRSHLWDNGADPVAELRRVMTLREVALQRFGPEAIPPGTPLSDLQEALVPVYFYHRYQVEAAGKLLGGVDYRYPMRGELAPQEVAAQYVNPAVQEDALSALLETLDPQQLAVPLSLLADIPPKAYEYESTRESPASATGALFDPLSLAESAATHTLSVILHRERLARVALQHSVDESQLSLDGLFRRLQGDLLVPEYRGFTAALDRRRSAALITLWRQLLADTGAVPEVRAAVRAALQRSMLLFTARQRGDAAYRDFYALQRQLIRAALDGVGEGAGESEQRVLPTVPPGSPIGAGA